ncbi:Hypothetical predicted protein [Prunus dulcis]|uniref:Uncharacterized protein n=1 Tax=Prunus dulcis TaxID=3755 RepID=A0A5E4EHX0_PRUDU|nr:Hypothetical predicted protein [Prunus dulcis]
MEEHLRVDGGEDAEIVREKSGYGWVLQGRRRSLAAIGEEEKTLAEKTTLAAIREEEKTLAEKTTLAGFSKEDDARWV